MAAAPGSTIGQVIETRNEVLLVGRLSAAAEQRELPSGDLLTVWRLVVDRAPSNRKVPEGVRRPQIDSLECVAWTAGLQRSAAGWRPGDVIHVEGALQRRFWRTTTGVASVCEIEVAKAKRLAKAA